MDAKAVDSKNARFNTRLSADQKKFFERAARLGGFRNLTDFILSAAQEKAKEVIAEDERILASERDAQLFFDTIMRPQAPNEALVAAAHQYNSLLKE